MVNSALNSIGLFAASTANSDRCSINRINSWYRPNSIDTTPIAVIPIDTAPITVSPPSSSVRDINTAPITVSPPSLQFSREDLRAVEILKTWQTETLAAANNPKAAANYVTYPNVYGRPVSSGVTWREYWLDEVKALEIAIGEVLNHNHGKGFESIYKVNIFLKNSYMQADVETKCGMTFSSSAGGNDKLENMGKLLAELAKQQEGEPHFEDHSKFNDSNSATFATGPDSYDSSATSWPDSYDSSATSWPSFFMWVLFTTMRILILVIRVFNYKAIERIIVVKFALGYVIMLKSVCDFIFELDAKAR